MATLIALHHKVNALPPSLRKEAYSFLDSLVEKSINDDSKIQRKFGSAKGKIHMSKDFDEPLTDIFKDYM